MLQVEALSILGRILLTMFILQLNNMQSNTEQHSPVARAETVEKLMEFLKSETVEPYTDIGYHSFSNNEAYSYNKTFRKSGPLEWYNPPNGRNTFYQEIVDVGTLDDRIRQTAQWWNENVLTIPEAL